MLLGPESLSWDINWPDYDQTTLSLNSARRNRRNNVRVAIGNGLKGSIEHT